MIVFIAAFLISAVVAILLLKSTWIHGHLSFDHDIDSVQKHHSVPVPRIGSVAILSGLIFGLLFYFSENQSNAVLGLELVLASTPIFFVGLFEDLTKRIGVRTRFLAALVSAAWAGYITDNWLLRLDIETLDGLLQVSPFVAVALTCFAVTGVTHAFNLIDGYNGLCSMVGVLILSSIAYVAYQVGDMAIVIAALGLIGALLGFFVFNYPLGLIFLGDAGAYVIGFWIAQLSVFLVARNAEVSPWFALLLCFYPVFETLFTIYRRLLVRRVSPGLADGVHLHHFIHKRVVKAILSSKHQVKPILTNSLTAPFLWCFCLIIAVPAVLWWQNTLVLQGFTLLFAVGYVVVYWRIASFKTPRWLKLYSQKKYGTHLDSQDIKVRSVKNQASK